MAKDNKKNKIQVKSLLRSVLIHDGLKIKPRAVVMLDEDIAKVLIKKGYLETLVASEV